MVLYYILGAIIVVAILFLIAVAWRVVVPANEAHLVQRSKSSTPYGSGYEKGNSYWSFPSWLPIIGTNVSKLPLSIFQIELDGYEAYDQEKVPFAVDVISFFKVENPIEVAKRASNSEVLNEQLHNVLRGSVRKILASKDINTIMETRSELNQTFVDEVAKQVAAWGVSVVSIEFTDIHDAPQTQVVTNIMNKKKSRIEKESRIEVAENMQLAKIREIEAQQLTEVRAVEAAQFVEMRNVERKRQVGVADQQASQKVKEEEQKTKEKEVAVSRTSIVGQAEYEREKKVIEAAALAASKIEQSKGDAESMKLSAEGYKNAQLLQAEGDSKKVEQVGSAEADIIKKKAVADAEGKLKLAEALAKIQKEGLQAQLGEKAIIAYQAIGVAVAEAYKNAEIKAVLTNGGGIESLGDLLSSGGGAKLGSFIEALKKVSGGENVLEALGMASLVPSSDKKSEASQAKEVVEEKKK